MADFTDVEKSVNERIRGSADMSACEAAYLNGYKNGLEDSTAYQNGYKKGLEDAYERNQAALVIRVSRSAIKCPSCGMGYGFRPTYCEVCGQKLGYQEDKE